jgi:hypothetical protein
MKLVVMMHPKKHINAGKKQTQTKMLLVKKPVKRFVI